MNDRRTIATQGAEISADFATFGRRRRVPRIPRARTAPADYAAADPDPDASYADRAHRSTCPRSGPYVARPGTVSDDNSVPCRRDRAPPRRPVLHRLVRQRPARGPADRRRDPGGRQVATGVRLIVTPASQAVYRDAVRLGYVEKIADAGAVVTNSTCGACFGYHMGVSAQARCA